MANNHNDGFPPSPGEELDRLFGKIHHLNKIFAQNFTDVIATAKDVKTALAQNSGSSELREEVEELKARNQEVQQLLLRQESENSNLIQSNNQLREDLFLVEDRCQRLEADLQEKAELFARLNDTFTSNAPSKRRATSPQEQPESKRARATCSGQSDSYQRDNLGRKEPIDPNFQRTLAVRESTSIGANGAQPSLADIKRKDDYSYSRDAARKVERYLDHQLPSPGDTNDLGQPSFRGHDNTITTSANVSFIGKATCQIPTGPAANRVKTTIHAHTASSPNNNTTPNEIGDTGQQQKVKPVRKYQAKNRNTHGQNQVHQYSQQKAYQAAPPPPPPPPTYTRNLVCHNCLMNNLDCDYKVDCTACKQRNVQCVRSLCFAFRQGTCVGRCHNVHDEVGFRHPLPSRWFNPHTYNGPYDKDGNMLGPWAQYGGARGPKHA